MEGRYLLGVNPLDQALAFIGKQTEDWADVASLHARDAEARARRMGRPASVPVDVAPLPSRFHDHGEIVMARELYQGLFGSQEAVLALVSLRSLVTIQPHVNFSFAKSCARPGMEERDILELCLPSAPREVEIWGGVTRGDSVACTICTRDLNLAVSEAKFDTESGMRVTFTLNRTAVFCQVVEVDGALYLKDGTHRAVGLLAAGYQHLPCVVVRGARERQVPTHLAADVMFGASKPLVADFLDPTMYMAHSWAERVKFIRIRVDDFVAPA